ncbi:MAG: glycerol-3-phosphate ABC transporter permease [Candidatus Hydrogenedentota bacterium]
MTTRAYLLHCALLLACGMLVLPFLWMALTSLKTSADVSRFPPQWFPSELRWENFYEAWHSAPFGRFYVNSAVTSAAATLLQVIFALLMAFAFAALRFPGKKALLIAVLATMMIPEEMKLVPNFILINRLGWTDTYWALIIPASAHAFPVFVLYQQFRMIPADLFEAAAMEGAGPFRTLVHVVTPLARPLLVAVALVSFLGRWNDYLWPLIVTSKTAMRTLPLGLAYLKQAEEGGNRWNLLMAATLIVVIPLLILYIIAQRHFVSGLTKGALKG